jgi:hypothetical protein
MEPDGSVTYISTGAMQNLVAVDRAVVAGSVTVARHVVDM